MQSNPREKNKMLKMFMATCLGIGFAFLPAAPALADPSMECGVSAASQVEIADCVGTVDKTVDDTVKIALGFAMDSAKELDEVTGRDVAQKALTLSQQNWSAYRDAQCEYVGATFGGGSGTGIAISSCRVEMGRQRVSVLMKGLN